MRTKITSIQGEDILDDPPVLDFFFKWQGGLQDYLETDYLKLEKLGDIEDSKLHVFMVQTRGIRASENNGLL